VSERQWGRRKERVAARELGYEILYLLVVLDVPVLVAASQWLFVKEPITNHSNSRGVIGGVGKFVLWRKEGL
jgi:hypothetical protein